MQENIWFEGRDVHVVDYDIVFFLYSYSILRLFFVILILMATH